jgi:hypothetical protein
MRIARMSLNKMSSGLVEDGLHVARDPLEVVHARAGKMGASTAVSA